MKQSLKHLIPVLLFALLLFFTLQPFGQPVLNMLSVQKTPVIITGLAAPKLLAFALVYFLVCSYYNSGYLKLLAVAQFRRHLCLLTVDYLMVFCCLFVQMLIIKGVADQPLSLISPLNCFLLFISLLIKHILLLAMGGSLLVWKSPGTYRQSAEGRA